ncbi:MAG: STAS domain-containing protein [Chloroherpetonaceae bacterium]|nr:STAS domain-containing protein [Chloroherpetonaceae bacterium]
MEFSEKTIGDVTLITLNGDMLGGPDANELHNRLRELIASGQKKLVIDLAKVGYMNSSGLGMLTSALTTVRNANGDLRLANPAERIKNLLIITKLVQVFQTFNSVDAAIASFSNVHK